jgi:hypothetical protein
MLFSHACPEITWSSCGTLLLFAVHNKFGSLAIAEILASVIAVKKGVVVTEFQAKSLADYRTTFIETNGPNSLFSQEYKVILSNILLCAYFATKITDVMNFIWEKQPKN